MKKITFILFAMLVFCWQSNAQDTCGTATAVTPGTVTGTTITQDSAGGQGDTGTTRDSAWFAYTATGDGTIDISSCEGGADTRLYVFDDCAGATIANNDDTCPITVGGSSFAAEITGLAVVSGTTYYIEWDDRWSTTSFDWSLTFTPGATCTAASIVSAVAVPDCGAGTFTIDITVDTVGDGTGYDDGTDFYPGVNAGTITTFGPYNDGDSITMTVVHSDTDCNIVLGPFTSGCTPANDLCGDAVAVVCGDTISGTNVAATDGDGVANDGCGTSATAVGVWYVYSGTGDTVTASVCNAADFDTEITVYTGVCGDLTCLGNNDDGEEGGVDCGLTSSFEFESEVGTSYYIYVSGFGAATGNFDLSITCVAPPACTPAVIDSADVVETCNPDGTGTFTVDIVVSDAGDAGSVFDDGTNTYPVVAGTVSAGPYNSGDSVTIELVALDADCSSTVGTFTFTCPPPAPENDNCVDAEAIACGDSVTGSTATATDSEADGVLDVFYSIAGTVNGEEVTVSLCGSSFDTIVEVYDACGGALVTTNDDSCSLQSETTFTSDGTTTYIVRVRGFQTASGDYALAVSCVPPPTCTPAVIDSSTIVEPTCTPAVIDSSTIVEACDPDGTGTFTVEHVVSNAGDEGTLLSDGTNTYAVVDGTVVTGPYNSGDTVTIDVVALDLDCNYSLGDFEFTCPEPAPENDDIAGAINLPVGDTVCETTVLGTNAGATDSIENDNTADCTFDGGVPLGDVWFKVIVPSTGELTIETSSTGEITDTVMTVYLGTSGSLVQVGCSDDEGDGAFSKVELTGADGISPGDVLLVRVWEYGDNVKGTFNICAWSPSTLGLDDNTFNGFTYYPNPVKDVLTLESPNTIDKIEVFNILGQRIVAIESQNTIQNIDMSNVQAGAYFVKVLIGNQIKTLRVIKE